MYILCSYRAKVKKKRITNIPQKRKIITRKNEGLYKRWAITKQNIVLTLPQGNTIDAKYLTFYQYYQNIQQLLKECKESKWKEINVQCVISRIVLMTLDSYQSLTNQERFADNRCSRHFIAFVAHCTETVKVDNFEEWLIVQRAICAQSCTSLPFQ